MPLRREQLELALDPRSSFFVDLSRMDADTARAFDEVVRRSPLRVAIRAVTLCAHARSSATLAVIERASKSERAAVREAAAAALGRRLDHRPALLGALLRDPEVRVRACALGVLASRPAYRRIRYARMLKELRVDTDPRIRRIAARVRWLSAGPRRARVALTG